MHPNEFARMAQDHWQTARPLSLARIPEKERAAFFRELGEQAAEELETQWMSLAGTDPAGESAQQKERRLNMAKLQAREVVLAEMILIPEDPTMFAEDEPTWGDVEADQEEELDTFQEWKLDQDPQDQGPTNPTEWKDWHDRRQDP